MAMSGDYMDGPQEAQPNYPTAFGIQFTPAVTGIVVGAVGVLGAGYVFVNFVQPLLDQATRLEGELQTAQQEFDQQKVKLKEIDEAKAKLAAAEQRKANVLTMFADEKALTTLLLDVNKIVDNAGTARVTVFTPGKRERLGDKALFQQDFTVGIEGNFAETTAVLRNLERLQPLLLMRDVKSEAKREQQQKVVVIGPPVLRTSFILKAITPPTATEAEQLKQAAAAAQQPPKK